MSAAFDRGFLLYQQSRYAQAADEFRRHLAEDPDDPFAHGLLALCHLERGEFDPAEAEADAAVRAGPTFPMAHRVRSNVFVRRNRLTEAGEAAAEALRLDPTDADSHAAVAAVRYARSDYRGTVRAAEAGLAYDPVHGQCTNLRAIALTHLGRTDEALAATAKALRDDPEDDVAHAARGWSLLRGGAPDEALHHFREALRLDATSEYARAGMVEAVKARYRVYRWVLGFFLWMQGLPTGVQWGVIVGIFVFQNALAAAAKQFPILWVPFAAAVGFVLLTWFAVPVANGILMLNRFGRLVLTRPEKWQARVVGGLLLVGLALLGVSVAEPSAWGSVAFLAGLMVLKTAAPTTACWTVPAGWPRWLMMALSGAMAVAGLAATWLLVGAMGIADDREAVAQIRDARDVIAWHGYGLLAAVLGANLLPGVRVRR